ncbi:hypothetical protein UF75_0455 [Desulfosporosinus sp. I2]|nr:hypothetical protein UF75_0455 [Desulfosporosinus sp. I2]
MNEVPGKRTLFVFWAYFIVFNGEFATTIDLLNDWRPSAEPVFVIWSIF